MERREVLALVGGVLGAGCSGFSSSTTETEKTTTRRPTTERPTEMPLRTKTDTPTDTPTETPTDTPTETPTETPTPTPTSYENILLPHADAYDNSNKTRLQVDYNWRVQDWIRFSKRHDPVKSLDGRKFLMVQFRVTNEGDEQIALTPDVFDVMSPGGVVYEHFEFESYDSDFVNGSLPPEETVTDWLAYELPEAVDKMKLVRDDGAYDDVSVSVLFTKDTDLTFSLPDV
jgi:hypothetical protein